MQRARLKRELNLSCDKVDEEINTSEDMRSEIYVHWVRLSCT